MGHQIGNHDRSIIKAIATVNPAKSIMEYDYDNNRENVLIGDRPPGDVVNPSIADGAVNVSLQPLVRLG